MSIEIVQQAINDIVAHGISIDGPCGAFGICNLVAFRTGLGILRKPNPKVNNCVIKEKGYAADIVMYPNGRIIDILKDGGGANEAVWNEGIPVDPVNYSGPIMNYPISFGIIEQPIPTEPLIPIGLQESNAIWLLQTLHLKIDNIANEFRKIVLEQDKELNELTLAIYNALDLAKKQSYRGKIFGTEIKLEPIN